MWNDTATQNSGIDSGISKVYSDYLKRLQSLTTGSKPLITNLTLSAQSFSFESESIVRAIEDQIQKVEPVVKLPLLYLVDSIVKNLGGVYVDSFSTNIGRVFVDSYKQVSPEQQEKFERVLSTWNANNLFSPKILNRINSELRSLKVPASNPQRNNNVVHVNPKFVPKMENRDSPQSHDFNAPSNKIKPRETAKPRPPLPKARNNFERRGEPPSYHQQPMERGAPFVPPRPKPFNALVAGNKRKAFDERPPYPFPGPRPDSRSFRPTRPHNYEPRPRFPFERPRPFVKHSSPSHFEKPYRPSFPRMQRPHYQNHPNHNDMNYMHPPFEHEHEHEQHHFEDQVHYMEDDYNSPNMGYPPIDPIMSHPPLGNLPAPVRPIPDNHYPHAGFNPASEPVGEGAGNVDPSLIKSLLDSGVIRFPNGNTDPTTLPVLHYTLPTNLDTKPMSIGSTFNISSLAALDSSIGNPNPSNNVAPKPTEIIALNHKDINTRREGAATKLYDETTLQCRQCGLRYPSGEGSQQRLDSHMDWHFRQNRKKKDRVALKRFQSRSWFSTSEDWSQSQDTEFDYQQEPAFFNEDAKPQNEIAQAIALLEKSTVVVPADHSGQACPICQDKFTSCWSDELEEWIYKNAVQINGQICHATCNADHASLSKKTASPFKSPQEDPIKNVTFGNSTNSNLMV